MQRAFDHVPDGDLDLHLRLAHDPLLRQRVAQQIADDRQQGEHACRQRHAAAHERLHAVPLLIGDQRQHDADHRAGEHAAHRPKGREALPVAGLCGDRRGHRAVGDVDGRIEDRAPENIGDEQVEHPRRVRPLDDAAQVHQKRGERYRHAHALDPRLESAYARHDAAPVAQAAHRHVGHGVGQPREHHDRANRPGGDAHDIRVELHEDDRREDEREIVAEIAEEIAELVPDSKGALFSLFCHAASSPFLFCRAAAFIGVILTQKAHFDQEKQF